MSKREALMQQRERVLDICRSYGASDVRLFGSLARGDADEASDIDLVVRFAPGRSLLDHGGLLMDLRELLGVEVDVVSEGSLSGRFGDAVRREAIPL